jgi:hypothetical protein
LQYARIIRLFLKVGKHKIDLGSQDKKQKVLKVNILHGNVIYQHSLYMNYIQQNKTNL